MSIQEELSKARLDKDFTSANKILHKLNKICLKETDMNLHDFVKYHNDLCGEMGYMQLGLQWIHGYNDYDN